MLKQKLDSLMKLLNEKGADELILMSPPNMGYLLDYGDGVLTIINRDGVTTVVPVLDYYRAREMLQDSDVKVLGYASYAINAPEDIEMISRESLLNIIIGNGNKVIAIDESRNWLISEIKSKAPNAAVIDVSNELTDMRSVKTQEEIELMRRAAKITLDSIMDVLEEGLSGRRERDVAASMYRHMIERGSNGVAFEPIIGSGGNGAKPHHTYSDKMIQSTEAVVMDVGARYKLYCADITRTMLPGESDKSAMDVYGAVKDAHDQAIKAIKPGVKASDIDAVARKVLEEYGLSKYFMHSLGHGVGIEVHERPFLSPSSDDVLRENQVVTIEPGVYIRDRIGVRIEDMVLVTSTGAIVISK
ncbi:MAG: Xaa-Pro peptidase family protein [Thermocladium sp.]